MIGIVRLEFNFVLLYIYEEEEKGLMMQTAFVSGRSH